MIISNKANVGPKNGMVRIREFPMYAIHRDGSIWSFKTKKYLLHMESQRQYMVVCLRNKNVAKTLKIHRLLAEHFIRNPNKYKEINHINGIKSDNRIENLEWTTRGKNIKHCYDLKLRSARGESNAKSKLRENDVIHIRKIIDIYKKQRGIFAAIAKKYNVSTTCIRSLYYRQSWSHLA